MTSPTLSHRLATSCAALHQMHVAGSRVGVIGAGPADAAVVNDLRNREGGLLSLVVSQEAAPAGDLIGVSWTRSARVHRLRPDGREAPRCLTETEVATLREPLHDLIEAAQEEMDRLYLVVRSAGYVVMMANVEGTVVHQRASQAEAGTLKRLGLWLGTNWSEPAEGTNGIGTVLLEQRPVSVHRDQHFRALHRTLSCAGAPVAGPDGRVVAVLDSSTMNPEPGGHAHQLVFAATIVAARAIEERLFREHFRNAWVVAAAPGGDSGLPMLLAFDTDRRIVGADRVARETGIVSQQQLDMGLGLSSLFGADVTASMGRWREDRAVLVTDSHGSTWNALVTPPAAGGDRNRIPGEAAFHGRPRIGALITSSAKPPAPIRGGLPPGMARRVRDYIDAHLSERVGLDDLASAVGLSLHHFARAFRQSFGVPPHKYLLYRRVERAQQLLDKTERSLSDIALLVGFSDHSHFARHFRRLTGRTPSASRRRQAGAASIVRKSLGAETSFQ